MSRFTKAKLIAGLVFNSIWLAVALFLWIGGLAAFIEMKADMGFGAWATWGFVCAIPMAWSLLKMAVDAGRSNARDGARVYTASIVGDTVYFRDNSWSYGFWGFVGGLIFGVLAGPIILPFFIFKAIKKIVTSALTLRHGVYEEEF